MAYRVHLEGDVAGEPFLAQVVHDMLYGVGLSHVGLIEAEASFEDLKGTEETVLRHHQGVGGAVAAPARMDLFDPASVVEEFLKACGLAAAGKECCSSA